MSIKIVKGSTYRDTLRWATSECVLKTAQLTPGAPLRLTCVGHGIPDGWTAHIEGHRDINPDEPQRITVVDADTIEISCFNGLRLKAQEVVVRFHSPVDLTGYSARMQVRDRVGGEILLDSTASEITLTIDPVAHTVEREIAAGVTEAIDWRRGVYDLEMVSGTYVTKIDGGVVSVTDEVTV